MSIHAPTPVRRIATNVFPADVIGSRIIPGSARSPDLPPSVDPPVDAFSTFDIFAFIRSFDPPVDAFPAYPRRTVQETVMDPPNPVADRRAIGPDCGECTAGRPANGLRPG